MGREDWAPGACQRYDRVDEPLGTSIVRVWSLYDGLTDKDPHWALYRRHFDTLYTRPASGAGKGGVTSLPTLGFCMAVSAGLEVGGNKGITNYIINNYANKI